MSGSYICAPYRRKLFLRWPPPKNSKWCRNASVVPFPSSSPPRPPRSNERADEKQSTFNGPGDDRTRSPDLLPLRYDHTVEDDFLDRLFNDRSPVAGTYSNPCRNDSSPCGSNTPHGQELRKQEAQQRRLQGFSSASRRSPHQNAIELRQPQFHKHLATARPLQSQIVIRPFDSGQDSASGTEDAPFHKDWAAQHGKEEMVPQSPSHTDLNIRPRGTSQKIESMIEGAPESPADLPSAMIRRPDSDRKALSTNAAIAMIQRVCETWCTTSGNAEVSPSQALDFVAINMRLPGWSKLWNICACRILVHAMRAATLQSASSLENRSTTSLLMELIYLWNWLLKHGGECHTIEVDGTIQQTRNSDDWIAFVNSEQMARVKKSSFRSTASRLGIFFPKLALRDFTGTDVLALTTLVLLKSNATSLEAYNKDQGESVEGFKEFMNNLLIRSDVSSRLSSYEKILSFRCRDRALATEFAQQIVTELGKRNSEDTTKPKARSARDVNVPVSSEPQSDQDYLDVLLRRIGKAGQQRHTPLLESLWEETKAVLRRSSPGDDRAKKTRAIFRRLLMAFMICKKPNRAIEIWNSMLGQGIDPGKDHWDAMIKGCGVAGDPQSLQIMWQKMLDAGIQPDAQLWGTRIDGLMSNGLWLAGLEAFEEMARSWLHFSRTLKGRAATPTGEPAGMPKPNTECLNVTITGLVRAKNYGRAVQVLQQAKVLKIKPDNYSFNPILKSEIYEGNTQSATKLIQKMRKLGLKPDVATLNLVLDMIMQDPEVVATFGSRIAEPQKDSTENPTNDSQKREDLAPLLDATSGRSAAESALKDLFGLVGDPSFKPSGHTYTVILSRLLDLKDPGVSAAYALLHFLSNKDEPVPVQVYTRLIGHHFSEIPPNTAAVDSLWHHCRNNRTSEGAHPALDSVFYSRLIQGWSNAGDIAKASMTWEAAREMGQDVHWMALSAFVRALHMVGDRGKLWKLLRIVGSEERELDRRDRGGGKLEFFGLLRELDLISDSQENPENVIQGT